MNVPAISAVLALRFSTAIAQLTGGAAESATDAVPPEIAAKLTESGSRSVHLHDPSTNVREGDTYWLFSTGRGVSSFRSTDLLTWLAGPPVFTNTPVWVTNAVPENRRMHFWAPDVIRHRGEYLLYYSVSSFGKNHSAIGLARAKTLDPSDPKYGWSDEGIVIQSYRTNDFNAIDPAVILDPAGGLWLSFGSFWSGIKLIELDPASGHRIETNSAIYSLAWHEQIEAPFIYHHDDFFYLFVNWGFCCRGTNSSYNIRVGRSRKITGPYLDREVTDMLKRGGTLLLETDGPVIGPGHAGIFKQGDRYWFSMHFYDGTRRGASTLAIRPLEWQTDGWPKLLPASAVTPEAEN